jgi:cytoskeletal protein RodZ
MDMVDKTKNVGAQLRDARQARGWTSKAAAKATKIKEQQLLQLENGEWGKFAAPAYVRGFVRIYAKTLGINESKILQELDKVLSVEGDDVYLSSSPVQYMPKDARKQVNFRGVSFFMMVGVIVAIVGILGWYVFAVRSDYLHAKAKATPVAPSDKIPTAKAVTEEEEAKPALPVGDAPKAVAVTPTPAAVPDEPVQKATPVSPVPTPAPAEEKIPKATAVTAAPAAPAPAPIPAPAAPAAQSAKALVVQAKADCWVRVTVIDNGQPRVLSEGVMRAGEQRDFPGEKFLVKMADPSVMTVLYNGKSIALGEVKVPTEYPLP